MVFDPQVHQDRIILIKCGEIRRRLKGLPEEKNITVLYNEIVKVLDLPVIEINSQIADHFLSPYESEGVEIEVVGAQIPSVPMSEKRTAIVKKLWENKKICPKCGKKAMELFDVCGKCDDFKKGFRSEWRCIGIRDERGKIVDAGCGEKVLDKKALSQWFIEFDIDVGPGIGKRDLGIKTVTDQGIR